MKIVNGFIGNSAGEGLNKLGHRCDDTDLINYNNYFLVAGDNFNLSFDKPISETYPYLLSKKLSMSYYNLSVFNGGMDVLKNNILVWKNRFLNPKFLIINFTFLNSLTHFKENTLYASDLSDPEMQNFYHQANYNGYFNAKKLLLSKLVVNCFTCPIYQFYTDGALKLLDDCIFDFNIPNHDPHSEIVQKIYDNFKSNLAKARP